jgi:methylmalonyl-CoA mutase
MTTRRDPWVNMLRTTVAAFSAGIGGADAVTVLPFTAALGLPDAFARRIARNIQAILLDEANLSRVTDPAAGAGGFEALTDALCEKAWGLFQEIEREGGILESLKGDTLQARITAVRAQREKAIATRKEPITGTSEFPNINDADVSVLLPMPAIQENNHQWPLRRRSPSPLSSRSQGKVRTWPTSPARTRDRHRSPSGPCPRSAQPKHSSTCETCRMLIWPRPERARRCFWPISDPSRRLPPVRPSPRISSKLAV